ncbi:MAG TPA: DinB family protein [Candidatus Sulfotelmatobacter sp.]|nr:DinB family protein [Candidatus Sulfotelmatobacter sp.]
MNSDLEKLRHEIDSAMEGVSPEFMRSNPAGRKWSIAEILEHLYLTYTGTIRGCERALEGGRPLVTAPTWVHRGRKLVVLRLGYMPTGRESPAVARPRGLPVQEVLTGIGSKIAEMDQLLSRCEEKFGAASKLMDHPALGALTASQWGKFHLVHGRHHVKQIHARRVGKSG